MKLISSILAVLISVSFLFSQTIPVYDTHPSGSPKQYWDDVNKYYVWILDSAATDSTLTSKTIPVPPGYDGLMGWYLQIDKYYDSGDALPDTNYVYNGNIRRGRSVSDSAMVIVKDTSWTDFNIWFMLQRYYGEPFGWKTEDTLTWTTHSTSAILGEVITTEATFYYSISDPRRSDGTYWEYSPPLPTRLLGTCDPAVDDTFRVFKIQMGYKHFTPNAR